MTDRGEYRSIYAALFDDPDFQANIYRVGYADAELLPEPERRKRTT